MDKHKVFVYGTLKKGFPLHSYLKDCKFLGEFTTRPNYTMLDLEGCPAVVKEGFTQILGEVYEVTDLDLGILDTVENYDPNNKETSMYIRETISTPYGMAYIYIFNMFYCFNIVEDGNWQKIPNKKR